MDHYLRDPASAAMIAAAVVMAYVYFRAKMNNEGPLKNSEFIKPGFLTGLLVYFIVSSGQASHEPLSKEPF